VGFWLTFKCECVGTGNNLHACAAFGQRIGTEDHSLGVAPCIISLASSIVVERRTIDELALESGCIELSCHIPLLIAATFGRIAEASLIVSALLDVCFTDRPAL
jgi:hypothetical protein